ncbi:hypothetical protein RFI_27199 [Reticulomyxa filosa]|uniref:Uncharacterized protein n=1 Tax=Reticulomyxa filosa TaxID=46433 RepID=X6M8D2_RETFI|nr:hypothetical protein RFI_27199 [Reticulomyxa filosa]|eukprot:ETO10179.1 hypothetical protein RFI_27199 [Reticulomyxa filosa]
MYALLCLQTYSPFAIARKNKDDFLQAKQLITRLKQRDIYRCCGSHLMSVHDWVDMVTTLQAESLSKDVEKSVCKAGQKQCETKVNETVNEINSNNNNNNNNNENENENNKRRSSIVVEPTKEEPTNSKNSPLLNYKLAESLLHDKLWQTMQELGIVANDMTKSDVIVQLMSLSYGMEDSNPIDNVFFFRTKTPNLVCLFAFKEKVNLTEISKLATQEYKEIIFRMYVKHNQVMSFFTSFLFFPIEIDNYVKDTLYVLCAVGKGWRKGMEPFLSTLSTFQS